MPEYVFPKVSERAVKRGKCPACGKGVSRKRDFYQTVSPYNLNEFGEQKSRRQIYRELKEQAEAWEPDFRHNTIECKEQS